MSCGHVEAIFGNAALFLESAEPPFRSGAPAASWVGPRGRDEAACALIGPICSIDYSNAPLRLAVLAQLHTSPLPRAFTHLSAWDRMASVRSGAAAN